MAQPSWHGEPIAAGLSVSARHSGEPTRDFGDNRLACQPAATCIHMGLHGQTASNTDVQRLGRLRLMHLSRCQRPYRRLQSTCSSYYTCLFIMLPLPYPPCSTSFILWLHGIPLVTPLSRRCAPCDEYRLSYRAETVRLIVLTSLTQLGSILNNDKRPDEILDRIWCDFWRGCLLVPRTGEGKNQYGTYLLYSTFSHAKCIGAVALHV